MNNPLEDWLDEQAINNYRLIDGSLVIAEEVKYDEEDDLHFVKGPLEFFCGDDGIGVIKPWIHEELGEAVIIPADKIISISETNFDMQCYYYKYHLSNKLRHIMTNDEIDQAMDEMFNPEVDNLDSGKSITDIHIAWRKKSQQNNWN